MEVAPSLDSIVVSACIADTPTSWSVSILAAKMLTWHNSRRCEALSQGMFSAHSFQTFTCAGVIPL